MNLDFLRWENPESNIKGMVEETKYAVEPEGFHQMIVDATRFWPGKPSSCINQVWTNTPQRVIKTWNVNRGTSDHNIVGADIRVKGVTENKLEFVTINWKDFDKEKYVQELKEQDWESLYLIENVDIVANYVEERIRAALNSRATIRKVQPRKSYKAWITKETRTLMDERDNYRKTAQETQDNDDWEYYRRCRNKCVTEVNKDRRKFFANKYRECEENGDKGGVYKIVRQQMNR